MGFFSFGRKSMSILPGIDKKLVLYSFMETGDLVYYQAPGEREKVLATVESFTVDKDGQPEEVTIILMDGTCIDTTINHISY